MSKEIVVVALGGNAITREFEEGLIPEQFENTRTSLDGVIRLVRYGYRVILTHGNGPQVGNALIRVEESRDLVPPLPLGIIVADLEGGMGYMIEQSLQNKLHDAGLNKDVTTVLTQVIVDPKDPSIKNPTKYVGPFFKKEQVADLEKKRGWQMKEDKGRGYRRVVPSPVPQSIVEKKIISTLLENDILVIAAGGGGIPVYCDDRGWLEGVDAVIDKDHASGLLGNEVGASKLIILTGVDKVAINFGTDEQENLDTMTIDEAEKHFNDGQFPKGSMGPKILAAINFLKRGGKEVLITSIENINDALDGKNGTRIINN
ncbi:MAG: carbamate kinase [Calditrichaeota bacterium]|nr:MAG: carbamate kinase [Calditrichota bacterium]MBL1203771.1 carbamate kinase [Calditrichota bacterium]NOG43601.1 carbamate kinase [Calditrichota bacterium]